MKLQDKVRVITGGNSGIGLAILKEFAGEGASVVIFGRNQKTLDEAAKAIRNGAYQSWDNPPSMTRFD